MKKLLSLILAITMIAAFIPTAFATDGDATTVTYTFTQAGKGADNNWVAAITKKDVDGVLIFDEEMIHADYKTTTSSKNTGYWAYLGTNVATPAFASTKKSDYPVMLQYNSSNGEKSFLRTANKSTEVDDWVALKIKVPSDGNYKVTGATAYKYTRSSENINIYILPMGLTVATNDEFNGKPLSEVFKEKSAVYGNISLDSSNCSVRSNAKKFSALGISANDQAKYKAASINTLGTTYFSSIGNSESVLDYSNPQVIELDADKEYVLLLQNATTNTKMMDINIESLTLTAEIEDEPTNAPTELTGNITFGAGAAIEYKKTNDAAFKTLSANGVDSTSFVADDSVTVKVTDTDNFAGWVRGTADSGVWVSSDPEYKFNIMSPTYLTPIYTTPEETATHAVEFWDENGAYVDTVTATDGKAVFPDESKYGLVGGQFNGWWLNETTKLLAGDVVAEGITRAVAQYNYGDFGKGIFNSDDTATYWKRGDNIVAYGSTYDFYKWSGEETITFGTDEIENKPLVVLESTPVDGAYMIEYDKGNAAEIVEAGIIFGSTADIHIGSTDGSKAASQRNGVDDGINDGHGQFCAKPNAKGSSDYARGYLIYRGTDNKLYVIYTAALATSAQ
ncbi:MAG: hypothetical protein IJN09_04465 [Oscillospiraceae bacterium]|nr:hypothetical protein [Oscillospiraceae bacterium]